VVAVSLHLGRLHPKKGIDRLLHAWASVEPRHPDWSLQIVGPSESGHGEALAAQSAALSLRRVEFCDPLFGAGKDIAYRNADLFVLPTLDENFGMVVAESLANGTPVICTKGAPWAALDAERCGWWIEHGVAPMAAMLEAAMNLPRLELDEMGARGHRWMEKEFSWERVADDMETVYRWCLSGAPHGSIPSVVDIAR
jgi:glycosyltransferase involved in cell wall biosynthesis